MFPRRKILKAAERSVDDFLDVCESAGLKQHLCGKSLIGERILTNTELTRMLGEYVNLWKNNCDLEICDCEAVAVAVAPDVAVAVAAPTDTDNIADDFEFDELDFDDIYESNDKNTTPEDEVVVTYNTIIPNKKQISNEELRTILKDYNNIEELMNIHRKRYKLSTVGQKKCWVRL